MDLKVIQHKPLKKLYLNFLAICLLVTAGSFILYKQGFQFFPGSPWAEKLKNIFLYGMICIALLFTVYQNRERKMMQRLPGFEEKLAFFENYYRQRLWFQVLLCIMSGFLLLLIHRLTFFYLLLFDLLMMFAAWPSAFMIKKEMNEDDLIFN